jgi:hypothetical protein
MPIQENHSVTLNKLNVILPMNDGSFHMELVFNKHVCELDARHEVVLTQHEAEG